MSFGEFLWGLLAIYFMLAYFMILFLIIGDLFRDHETGGLAKTAWFLALLFVPVISMCVYVITRGRSMNERAIARRDSSYAGQRDYRSRTTVATDESATEIAKARDLLDSGTITQREFDTLKAKALA